MKHLLKAALQELIGLLLLFAFFAVVAGVIALVMTVAGNYSTAVFLLLALVIAYCKISWDTAQRLKRSEK